MKSYQYPPGSGLTGYQFARPVFGLCHKRALELLFALPLRLLFGLGVRATGRRELGGLFAREQEREEPP